jgi:hypothetical protein
MCQGLASGGGRSNAAAADMDTPVGRLCRAGSCSAMAVAGAR